MSAEHAQSANHESQNGSQDLSLLDLMRFVLRAWKWIFVYVAIALAVTSWRYSKHPSYTASGTFIIENARSNALQAITEKIAGGAGYYEEREERLEKYLMVFSSNTFMKTVAEHVRESSRYQEIERAIGMSPGGESELELIQLARKISGLVTFTKLSSEIVRVSVTLEHPEDAVLVGNEVMRSIEQAIVDRESNDMQAGRTFLERQMAEIGKRLKAIDDEIGNRHGGWEGADAAASAGAGGRGGSDSVNLRMNDLESKLLALRVDLSENESMIREVEAQAGSAGSAVGFAGASNDKYGPQAVLSDLKSKRKRLELQLEAYEGMLKRIKESEKNSPREQRILADLFKKKEMEYLMYNEIERQVMSLDVQKISVENKVKTLETVTLAAVHTVSLVPDLVKRGVLAMLLACLTVYLMENVHPLLKGKRDLRGLGLHYLGSIPRLEGKPRRFSLRSILTGAYFRSGPEGQLHALDIKPDSFYDVVFKNIRAKVTNFRKDGKAAPKVLAIMSPYTGEGKSSVASHLARSLAMGKRRVLLVDCDLRKRSLTRALGFEGEPGFTEFLSSPNSEFSSPVVKRIGPNLELLPAGQYAPGCSELFYSQGFNDVINALSQFYDHIVLDTPPAVPFSEVIPITSVSDLVVLCLMVRKTPIDAVEKVLEKLRFASQVPISFVLNKDDTRDMHTHYPYYIQTSWTDAA